jgi:16S rRNA processing protein RimM
MDASAKNNNADEWGSESAQAPEPRYLLVGRVLKPHGIRGEIRVEIITAYPERLIQHTVFYLAHPHSPDVVERYAVESARFHKDIALLKLTGCPDRNAAEQLRDMWVQIPAEEAAPLEEGEFYLFQLIGAQVETETGELLGCVVEVIETGANDVYVVHGPRGEVLLPAIQNVVIAFDPQTKHMVVRPLPGTLTDPDET